MLPVLAYVLLLLPTFTFADSVSELVQKLKNTEEAYNITGTICEQAAKIELEREFQPPRFNIQTGISYGMGGSTMGELDVVVFDADKVTMVAEVKCWKDFGDALQKAKSQRKRFQQALGSGRELLFWHDKVQYDPAQFNGLRVFESISQKGGKANGFNRELSFSLDELMDARQRLLTCQAGGRCE
jgi:hypothetical protein